MKNKKGFVLLETLVVTIFTLIIFTLLYTSTVPLLGKYKDLSYYNDIDITYDLYYLKRLIKNDSNYNNINNSSYQSIKCTDLSDANTCNSYFNALNIKKNDELVYLDLKKLNENKKYLSSDILDYVNRIDKKYDNSKILILKRNDYISFVKWFEPTEPVIKFDSPETSNTCGYENEVTIKITCNSPDGIKSFKINNEEVTDLENLKSKTIEKTISSSTSFQVTCTSKYDLTENNNSDEFAVCEYKSTGTCIEYNSCPNSSCGCKSYKCSGSSCGYTYGSWETGICKNSNQSNTSSTEWSCKVTYEYDVCNASKAYICKKRSRTAKCCSSAGCKTYKSCPNSTCTCKTYEQAWIKK